MILNIQITIVRTLSKTMRVVADISFVTLIPAKLKNAIEIIVPKNFVYFQIIVGMLQATLKMTFMTAILYFLTKQSTFELT